MYRIRTGERPAGNLGTGGRFDPRQAWRDARDILWERRGRMGLGLILTLISRGASLVLPASTKYVVDEVITRGEHRLLPLIAAAAGAALLIQAASGFALAQILGVAAHRSITDMRRAVHRKVLHLPSRYFETHSSGSLISRVMSDADGLRNLVGTGFVQLIGGIATAIVGLVVLFVLNWRLTLITLLALALFALLMTTAFRKIRPLFREQREVNAEVTARLNESLGGIRVVKSYRAEKREELVFTRGAHKLLRLISRSITAGSAVGSATTLLFGIVAVVMMVVGAQSVIAGTMTLGEVAMYIAFSAFVARPVAGIANVGTQMTEAFAGLERIREILNEHSEDEGDESREPLDSMTGRIEFRDVGFSYGTGDKVLHHVSFVAEAGTTTALVGPSGSGKSTLISLVMTFYDPSGGTILLDGRDLSRIRRADYRRHLGVVLQENFLFDGTIMENIRYGNSHASADQVREVARIAHVEEFVAPLEHGYDTIIGERGIRLSGGQRQRISIARAILADPTILILDEATSNLDSENEEKIQDGLSSLRKGRTTFVIAHRLSTIQSADQILVLDEGRIVERGTHAELIAAQGRYRQLYDKQYKLEMNRFINPGEEMEEVGNL